MRSTCEQSVEHWLVWAGLFDSVNLMNLNWKPHPPRRSLFTDYPGCGMCSANVIYASDVIYALPQAQRHSVAGATRRSPE
jgi:hypothetical protein